jgi:hypothetical protein
MKCVVATTGRAELLAGLMETEMQVIRDANEAAFSSPKIPFFLREHWRMVWSFLRR